ncbi:MAG: DUF4214 domain-containing protein [Actinomycetota bacterium]|nr:DUF4214 domain-containing protein [Actinomycetota bacterium]
MELSTQTTAFSRRRLIAGGLALGTVPLLPRFMGTAVGAPLAFGFPEPDMTSRVVRPIEFPVDGPVNWTDTYGKCRDGCSRRHEGQDLLGHKLEKLVACVDATVVGFKYDTTGNYLYLQDADGWHYGYLHINNDDPGTDDGQNPRQWAFATGIAMGAKVRKGQLIAYMGDSGNAEATTPHCHFEVRKPADAWYHAQAVNPKYSLDAASHGGTSAVPATTFAPWSTSTAFITQQYVDFLDRRPNSAEVAQWTTQLDGGSKTPADLVEWIIQQPGSADCIAPLIRLYMAFFGRLPDNYGLLYWISRVRRGASLDDIADDFYGSAESHRRYAALDNSHYVDQLYVRILGTAPDVAGHAYWTKRLQGGISRGRLMRYFVETDYYKFISYSEVRVCLVYAGMLRRAPDQPGYDYWTGKFRSGTPFQAMISAIKASASYRRRFPTAP